MFKYITNIRYFFAASETLPAKSNKSDASFWDLEAVSLRALESANIPTTFWRLGFVSTVGLEVSTVCEFWLISRAVPLTYTLGGKIGKFDGSFFIVIVVGIGLLT